MVVGGCVVGPLPDGTTKGFVDPKCDLCGKGPEDACEPCKPFVNVAKATLGGTGGIATDRCLWCRGVLPVGPLRERGFCDDCKEKAQ